MPIDPSPGGTDILDLSGNGKGVDLGDAPSPGGGVIAVGLEQTRAQLKARTPAVGDLLYITDAGDDPWFRWMVGNYTAEHAQDNVYEMLYIQSDVVPLTTGCWVRQWRDDIKPTMAIGFRDCTGTPKLADEVVYDNAGIMNAAFTLAIWLIKNRKISLCVNWSQNLGIGMTQPLSIMSADINPGDRSGQAIWNRANIRIKPGRLVAMARINLVVPTGGNFINEGTPWELWAGTDTQLNGGDYGARFGRNGMVPFGIAGATMGDVFTQGFQRYGIQYDKTYVDSNNDIPVSWGYVKNIQCGSRNVDGVKPSGTYTNGAWVNQPAMNGNELQRHAMRLPLAAGINPDLIELGDAVICLKHVGDTFEDAAVRDNMSLHFIRSIDGLGANYADVQIYPYAPIETGGKFLLCMGGGVSAWGSNLANNTFVGIENYSCGVGIQVAALYAPTIKTFLAESTMLARQIGANGGESMEGVDFPHYHNESVFWDTSDTAAGSGINFGTASNLQGGNRGKFQYFERIGPNSIVGGVWQRNLFSPRGFSVAVNGGILYSPSVVNTMGRDLGGLTNHGGITVGNKPEDHQFRYCYTPSGFSMALFVDRTQADVFVKHRHFEFGPIYGAGTNDAPTEGITFTSGNAGVTIQGGASYTIAPGDGAIVGIAIYEPPADNSDNGNWKIMYDRVRSDGDVVSGGGGGGSSSGSRVKAFPTADLTTLTNTILCDFQQLTHLWQDTAGTVAAVVGNTVARIDDLSGNGWNLSQGTAGSRAKLRKYGSLYLLEPDGVDDYYPSVGNPFDPAMTQPFTIVTAGLFDDAGSAIQTLCCGIFNVTGMGVDFGGPFWRFNAGTIITGGVGDSAFHVFALEVNGANSKLFVDDPITPVATGNAGATGMTGLNLFASNGPSQFVKGLFSGFMMYQGVSLAKRKGGMSRLSIDASL